MIKAVLFDCDGVLLDTEALGCQALADAISAAGVPFTPAEALVLFSGGAAAECIEKIAELGLGVEVFEESDRLLFESFKTRLPLIDGVESVLASSNLRLAVCSNGSIHRLRVSLQTKEIAKNFGPHIYSADHVARGKPAPDLALYACQQLNIAPHEAIFIDDNIHGVACAAAAGCVAVGFIGPTDHREGQAERLRAAGAQHVVRGMAEFQALLASL